MHYMIVTVEANVAEADSDVYLECECGIGKDHTEAEYSEFRFKSLSDKELVNLGYQLDHVAWFDKDPKAQLKAKEQWHAVVKEIKRRWILDV